MVLVTDEDRGALVGKLLDLIDRQPILVHEHMVVGRPAGAFQAGMGDKEEVGLCRVGDTPVHDGACRSASILLGQLACACKPLDRPSINHTAAGTGAQEHFHVIASTMSTLWSAGLSARFVLPLYRSSQTRVSSHNSCRHGVDLARSARCWPAACKA